MPVISLSSDLGTGDPYLYSVKLELYKNITNCTIYDLNHHLNSFNLTDAAYNCKIIFQDYPFLKYNLVLYKLLQEKEDFLVLMEHQNRYFFFPNNGLIFLCHHNQNPDFIQKNYNIRLFDIQSYQNHLDYARILAEIINNIESKKAINIEEVPLEKITRKNSIRSVIQEKTILASLIYIDKKSNIVLDLTQKEFEEARQGRKFKIFLQTISDTSIEKISPYRGMSGTNPIAFFNEFDLLTLSIPTGELARLLGYIDRSYDYGQEGAMYYPYYNNNKIFINFLS